MLTTRTPTTPFSDKFETIMAVSVTARKTLQAGNFPVRLVSQMRFMLWRAVIKVIG